MANIIGTAWSATWSRHHWKPRAPVSTPNSDRIAAGSSLARARIRSVQEAATASPPTTSSPHWFAGALRDWMTASGELPRQTLVSMCPVSVRSRDDEGISHRRPVRAQGCARWAPTSPIRSIGSPWCDAMANIKHQVASKGSSDAMLAVMGPTIGSTVALPLLGLGGVLPPSCNLAISNVPGPRETMYYNGARLDEIFGLFDVRRNGPQRDRSAVMRTGSSGLRDRRRDDARCGRVGAAHRAMHWPNSSRLSA